AIFLTDLVAATLLAENGVTADGVAGFSLGELPAVAFGGLLPTKQAFELTQFRAAKMHQATIAQKGGMLAVLGLSDEIVNRICEDVGKAYPVNYNAPGQVVVAFFEGNWGDLAEFDGKSDNLGYSAEKSQNKAETVQSALIQAVKAAKGKTVPLAVAGAFHSPLMDGVSQDLSAFLENVTFAQPKLHIYANVSAKPYSLENAAELLAKQVNSPVLWKSTIENMIADGFTTFVETGPGKTLAGLIKKIAKNNENVRIYNVYDKKTLEEVLSNVK
ncbi:MAG: ACP S-malonyltransferase, partial [Firmicutes bacterium]|nr:ACP S-malonyltransferase [Bacillota bacterium]